MTTVPLMEQAVIRLNGLGAGVAKIGPLTAREVWHPSNVSVSANNPPTNEAQCVIYVGDSATQANFRDATQSGSTGDSTDKVSADTVPKGKYVWAVWSGGDAGVQATLAVTGTKDV